ncbi:TPA: 50S ribosomal protein L17 [candidate division CPR2 bacterium]|uniref:Large ribosomal subunit protein bL17 n=1 Tax=candidate division CPR2 bacterium GW2011_GWC1_41_48 TaxID=1618344 RepID=A0A0G0YH33_UNCC2|nr:MAG: 50S ribosomal protein L17 [candidate division CPR2 bacterium GW2011_GWC2_39_35]KKR27175.1 MAG: 50S ribosomal protein L17 [candidate division CPR2 bacterium GW2011_GWD2_39_7]KKR29185.1 MAG: 50S ribosomal protein L17 [candidate division CPR2 bacterium GW2011_GWD1_39_7]KKS08861.1 MAG: 50S ribosomal protein L17 [candidate division CPR2 bacterium GW2011_GWC1_41_48]OGB62165.1 MAG: 50S ribosomal protein L17 [candidate division CPR2 bacterium GWD1_39_7]OGB70324.1 MAG: 50S ribosomal protein L17
MHRHKHVGRKLGREAGHRRAMLRNLATSLILHERVETTVAKAKEIRPIVERLITTGKKGDLAARRRLLRYIPENAAAKVMEKIAVDFKDREGGYTRILKTGFREGDAAPTAIIEFVGYVEEKKNKKQKSVKTEETGETIEGTKTPEAKKPVVKAKAKPVKEAK